MKVAVKAGRQMFAPYLVYVLGIAAKRMDVNTLLNKNRIVIGISSFLLLLLLNQFGRVDLSMGFFTNLPYFAVVSSFGYAMVISISYCIEKFWVLRIPLEYLGKHTMCIIVLHLLSFKVVSYIYVFATKSDSMLLASFPVLDNTARYLWMAYSVVGIVLPVICYQFYRAIRGTARKLMERK